MLKLPIGIQSFAIIRQEGYCYVDKTPLIARLAEEGRYYFLARPRRFGKSLLVDTLSHAFAGNRALFEGLYLEGHWDWGKRHPVVRLDFAESILDSRARLDEKVSTRLDEIAQSYGISLRQREVSDRFHELIVTLHRQSGQPVVVLVDEYDKPILDNLADQERALALREGLRNLYSVLKAQGEHLRFVLLTGVSKFSKVSLFSGLNNLEDITLDPRFATLCGYTQRELEAVFADYLHGVDREAVRRWYNGYNFLGEGVYNPFDVLLYLRNRQFRSYWFEAALAHPAPAAYRPSLDITGTPTFLIERLLERRLLAPQLEAVHSTERLLSTFDVDAIEAEALLFQTGYLTIHEAQVLPDGSHYFRLGYPNHEVKQALNDYLLAALVQASPARESAKMALLHALQANDLDRLGVVFQAFFDAIPFEWYTNNPMANYEGYYCAVAYGYFAALGLDVTPEESVNQGRIDMSVRLGGRVYLLEFKVTDGPGDGSALAQIQARGYQGKYVGQACYLIGVEFDRTTRNIGRYEWDRAE